MLAGAAAVKQCGKYSRVEGEVTTEASADSTGSSGAGPVASSVSCTGPGAATCYYLEDGLAEAVAWEQVPSAIRENEEFGWPIDRDIYHR